MYKHFRSGTANFVIASHKTDYSKDKRVQIAFEINPIVLRNYFTGQPMKIKNQYKFEVRTFKHKFWIAFDRAGKRSYE